MKIKTIVLCMLTIIFTTGKLSTESRIKDIKSNPSKYSMERITIKGKVVKRCIENEAISTRSYLLKDADGDEIKIVSPFEYPKLDQVYEVTGIIVLNSIGKDILEINLIEICKVYFPISQLSVPISTMQEQTNKSKWVSYILFGISIILLVVVAFLAFTMISKKYKVAIANNFSNNLESETSKTGYPNSASYNEDDNKISTPDLTLSDSEELIYPKPKSIYEDNVIGLSTPPENTMKLLPFKLEIISGFDKIREIPFFKPAGIEETEYTFGRGSGPNYTHFRLKSPAVSVKQAKLVWTNNNFFLLNYSITNPVEVNGLILQKDQSVLLEHGAVLKMGELIFKFIDYRVEEFKANVETL